MCGIIGYTGRREASLILLQALARLEYRGYDSAGLAIELGDGRGIDTRKLAGGVDGLRNLLDRLLVHGCSGIAHTPRATPGTPNRPHAHPPNDSTGRSPPVHN